MRNRGSDTGERATYENGYSQLASAGSDSGGDGVGELGGVDPALPAQVAVPGPVGPAEGLEDATTGGLAQRHHQVPRAEQLQAAARDSVGGLQGDVAEQVVRQLAQALLDSLAAEDTWKELLQRAFDALPDGPHRQIETILGFGKLTTAAIVATAATGLIDQAPDLQRLAPAPLNIVCFRFLASDLDEEALNRLNKEILIQLHEKGIAAPSYTTLNGRYAIRAAITNHRSRREDFEMLVDETIRLGKALVESPPA